MSPPVLHAVHTPERIALFRSGVPSALVTQSAATDHRPYIHPILAPDGVGELTENEPGHHLWQHGLYVGLNDVNGVGFWTEGLNNSKEYDGTFHPQPLVPPTITGNQAQWEVVCEWRTPGGDPMLTETQRWSLEDRGEFLVLDMAWHLRAQTDLRFGQYSYGGLFLRMPWREGTGNELLTSAGATTPREAEGQRARWVAVAMPIPGRDTGLAGIALLDHPANPEHPAPWRVDNNYGIVPSRCIAGEWFLPEGEITVSRYRVFAFTGAIRPDTVREEWDRFARDENPNKDTL
ncbi:MAG: PmoA family protein [Akkermansiaceae bacterium]|nr:PmoA family protein [Armatimonadota bacterium]